MNVVGRGRDEAVVRALRAESEQRRQARRRRRALIVKLGVGVVVPALWLATAATLTPKCKRESPRFAGTAVQMPPLVEPMPAPVCPNNDGLEDDDRVAALTREFQALRTPPRALALRNGVLTRGLHASRDLFTRCARAAPSSHGMITVKTVVAPDGRVTRTRVTASPLANAVGRCFAAAVAATTFPPSDGFNAEFPFVMTHPEPVPWGCPESVTARRLRLLSEAMEAVSSTCAGPNGLDVCSPGEFRRTFGERLAIIEQNRATAELRWRQALDNDDDRAAYGLAWLRSRKALPVLRERLLDDFIDASTDYDAHRSPQHQMTLTMAIEHISGRPVRQIVKLTPAERRTLRDLSRVRMTDACYMPPERTTARWFLHRLDGVPLRNPAWNIPANVRCRPRSSVAIAY